MALTDPILADFFDENNNLSESKRNEIIDNISKTLSQGSDVIKKFLQDKLGFDIETIQTILPDFGSNNMYSNGEIDLKDVNKFSQFHNEYINVLFKSILAPLNIPGQAPLLALGIFDPTGLLPDFNSFFEQIKAKLPPELKGIKLKFPLTIIQLAVLAGITQELIQPLFNELNLNGILLSNIMNLSPEDLVSFIKDKITQVPQEFSVILGDNKEKYLKLLFGILGENDVPPNAYSQLIKIAKEKFNDFILKAFREKIKSFLTPALLTQVFPFPPPLPIPPVTLPIDLFNKIKAQIESFKNIIPIPEIPKEIIQNPEKILVLLEQNKTELDEKLKKYFGYPVSATELLNNEEVYKLVSSIIPIKKIDPNDFINLIKEDITKIIIEKTAKYTTLIQMPLMLIGQIFSKVDTILKFIKDFSSQGIKGLLKNFFLIISGLIAPLLKEGDQKINSLKDLTPFQFAIAIEAIKTLITSVLSVIIGSIFGKGELSKSITNFLN